MFRINKNQIEKLTERLKNRKIRQGENLLWNSKYFKKN